MFVAYEGVQSLDVLGPLEAFAIAARVREGAYRTEIVTPGGGAVRTTSGVAIGADGALDRCRGAIDTLVVAGGVGVHGFAGDAGSIACIRGLASRSRRVASVCTGAFALAEAGLLDGKRATTHWSACRALAAGHPGVAVESDPIFVRDGSVSTSAGVTAGIDLALALVEEDLGPRVAVTVARWLVLFVRRPGGQAQFSAQLAGDAARSEPLRDLQAWIVDHLDADLSVPALAARAFMSERNFARAFRAEVGMTPAAYVETVRIERARLLLEAAPATVDEVARRCGFRTPETFRRAFRRRLGVAPADYRDRFRAERSSAA